MRNEVRADLRFEQIDDEIVVLDASGGTVHSLDGDAAEALRLVLADESIPARLEDAVDGLRAAGIVEQPAGWSRRKALLAGGVGVATAATGLFSMALPAAAAASSCPGAGGLGDDLSSPITFGYTSAMSADGMFTATSTNGTYSFRVGTMVTMVTVQVWGGGGGGGNGDGAFLLGGNASGGGGGGGGYATTVSLGVQACSVVDVVVGMGGTVSTDAGETGGDGGTSSALSVSASGGMGGGGGMSGALVAGVGGPGGEAGTGLNGTTLRIGGAGGDGMSTTMGDHRGGGGGGSAGTGAGGMAGTAGDGFGGGTGGAAVAGGGAGGGGAYAFGGTAPGTPGGGGGGGGSTNTGQPSAGAPGQVTISLA